MSGIVISGGSVKEAVEYENLDHLALTACADITDPVNMTAEVADNTILANILTDDGDTSSYDRRTDSLEAISDIAAAALADTAAMLVLTESGSTITTDGTEQNVYIADAPGKVYRPVCVKIDCTAHTAGETIVLRTYYRVKSGGNYIVQTLTTHAGAISPALLNITLEPNRYGVKLTIEKTGGTNRAYDYAVFYEV